MLFNWFPLEKRIKSNLMEEEYKKTIYKLDRNIISLKRKKKIVAKKRIKWKPFVEYFSLLCLVDIAKSP